jgi:DNA-binding transcriptional MerR regulator
VGGARRYSPEDLDRVARIRRLQELLGQDLEQIRRVLDAEDRLAELRAEWNAGSSAARKAEMLGEAIEINNSLRAQVKARIDALRDFALELDGKARRYQEITRDATVG